VTRPSPWLAGTLGAVTLLSRWLLRTVGHGKSRPSFKIEMVNIPVYGPTEGVPFP
jgi:hypothetical protein